MINTTAITKAFINSHHGWAVADQFEVTFEQSESFERQNYNALLYIRAVVRDLIDSDVLSDDAADELESYYDDLANYLAEGKEYEDEGPEYDSAGFTEEDRIVNGQYRDSQKDNDITTHHCDDPSCNCSI